MVDGDKVDKYHTSPLLADSDGDGIPDGIEIQTATDLLNRGSYDLKKATANSVLSAPPSHLGSDDDRCVECISWTASNVGSGTTIGGILHFALVRFSGPPAPGHWESFEAGLGI